MPQLGLARGDVRPAPPPQLRRLWPKTDHVYGAMRALILQSPDRHAHISTMQPSNQYKVQVQLAVFFALDADRDSPTQGKLLATLAHLPATV